MLASDELIIREVLATKVAAAIEFAHVIPAPIYFTGREDFLATKFGDADTDPETQYGIDIGEIEFACLYLRSFEDDPDSSPHSPLTTLVYELYLFCEYDYTRADETVTPDAFNKLMLLKHNEFIASIIQLKSEFQGELNFVGLSGYVETKTLPIIVRGEIQNNTECEFVPGTRGNSIRLELRVRVQMEGC